MQLDNHPGLLRVELRATVRMGLLAGLDDQ